MSTRLKYYIIRENGIAEMYVFGGYCGEGYKMKDVWKATFTARGKDIDVLRVESDQS